MSRVGELDGVTDKVEEDLLESMLVRVDRRQISG